MTLYRDEFGRLDPDAWEKLAAEAFIGGMRDAAILSKPRPARDLGEIVERIPDRRTGHGEKIRQVYGAGFDIGKMHLRIRDREGAT